jgi:glucose/arabinose dehydrogenase
MSRSLLLAFIIGGLLGIGFTFFQSNRTLLNRIPLPPAQDKTFDNNAQTTTVLTQNLEIPWSLVFLPDNRILVTERPGRVKLINSNGSIAGEVLNISEVKHQGEGGLTGLTLDPDFQSNKFVYMYYTYETDGKTMNKVARYKFNDNKLEFNKSLLGTIPGSLFHNGGRIKFGPDKLLYITTGDAQDTSESQDKNSLAGKILRMRRDGSNLEVFSIGHRNPQGLDWLSGKLYITEHGPSGGGSNCCRDEINLVEKGKNYGWPQSVGDKVESGTIAPLLHSSGDTWAPSGAVFYNGKLFFAGLRGTALYEFNPSDKSLKAHFKNEFGRIRDVAVGPDNLLYILTNNRDGRGFAKTGDDKIIVVNPEKL